MITLAFDGPDGSGKTPCVHYVAHVLTQRGLSVHLSRPYRELGDEGYPLWQTDPMRAADSVRRVIEADLRAAKGSDVVIFDRHWPTAAVTTTDWRAVELIRQHEPDHLFLMVPDRPQPSTRERAWHTNGLDPHWIAYRCLAEALPGVHRPRDEGGTFDFASIAAEVVLPEACLVVLQKEGEVLGIERGFVHGAWGLPGGKREPGESRQECAARELREETGLIVLPERLVEVHRNVVEGYDTTTFKVDGYESTRAPQDSAEGAVRWISWEGLLSGSFSEYNREVKAKL